MKLAIKAKRYVLNAGCGCTKNSSNWCGVTYRVGS